jgi:hypothetical protein
VTMTRLKLSMGDADDYWAAPKRPTSGRDQRYFTKFSVTRSVFSP